LSCTFLVCVSPLSSFSPSSPHQLGSQQKFPVRSRVRPSKPIPRSLTRSAFERSTTLTLFPTPNNTQLQLQELPLFGLVKLPLLGLVKLPLFGLLASTFTLLHGLSLAHSRQDFHPSRRLSLGKLHLEVHDPLLLMMFQKVQSPFRHSPLFPSPSDPPPFSAPEPGQLHLEVPSS
jgi:hypothetical protein